MPTRILRRRRIVRVSETSDDVLVRLLNGDEEWVYCQRLKLRDAG